jgi:hypothetical protein
VCKSGRTGDEYHKVKQRSKALATYVNSVARHEIAVPDEVLRAVLVLLAEVLLSRIAQN